MAISEKQFEEMIRGTQHEGKYSKAKPASIEQEARKVKPVARPVSLEGTKTEDAASVFMKVLPWAVGIRLATSPMLYVFLFCVLIAGLCSIEYTVNYVYTFCSEVFPMLINARVWAFFTATLLLRKWWKSRG